MARFMARSKARSQRMSLAAALFVAASFLVIIGVSAAGSQAALLVENDDLKSQTDNVQWKKTWVKDLQREMDDIKRESKNAVDISTGQSLTQSYDACIAEMEKLVGGESNIFWDTVKDCDDIGKNIDDHMQDVLRPARNCQNYKNNAVNRRRESKDMTRQLKDIKHNDKEANVADLEGRLTQLAALLDTLEQTAATCNRDNSDTAQDVQRDVDDGFRDWYDLSSEISTAANDKRRLTDGKSDFEKNIKKNCEKDKARELKNVEKELTRNKVANPEEALASVRTAYGELCGTLLKQMEDALAQNDVETFESVRQDYWDKDRDFWDGLNAAREQSNKVQQSKDQERNLKDKLRYCKDKDREYKRAVKDGRVTPALEEAYQKVSCAGSLIQGLQTAVANGDTDSFWNLNNEYDEADRTFWDINNESNFVGNISRTRKDLDRECSGRARELKRMTSENKREKTNVDLGVLAEIVARCQSLVKDAETAAAAQDFETLKDIFDFRMNDEVRVAWDEAFQNFFAEKEMKFLGNEVGTLKKDLANGLKEVDRLLSKKQITQERADVCYKIADKGKSLLAEMEEVLASGDSEQTRDVMQDLEELGYLADTQCIAFSGGPQNVRDVINDNFKDFNDDFSQNTMEDIFKKINSEFLDQVVGEVTKRISTTVLEDLLSKAGGSLNEQLQSHLAGLLENTVYLGDKASYVIETKTEFLNLVEQIQERSSRNGGEGLRVLLDQIRVATPVGDVAEQLKNLTVRFLEDSQDASGSALKSLVNEFSRDATDLLGRVNESAYEAGYIPCKDTGMDQWFTKYAAELIDSGIISGKKDARGNLTGECAPGENVLLIEVLKMVYNTAQVSEDDLRGTPSVACAEWAHGYCAYAENSGSFLKGRFKNWNVDASRSVVVRLVLEALGVTDLIVPESPSFNDVKTSHLDYKYIETAKAFRLVSGDSGPGTFRPDDSVKRGEIFKIIKNAMLLKRTLEQQEEF